MIKRIYTKLVGSAPFQELKGRLQEGQREIVLHGLSGSLLAAAVACVRDMTERTVLLITADEDRAEALRDDIEQFMGNAAYFPAWDVPLHEERSPHLDVTGLRLETLDDLASGQPIVGVTTVQALLGHTLPPDIFALCRRTLKVGEKVSISELTEHLVDLGFERVVTVEGVGQFSVRGGILDVCSFGNDRPVRAEFFDDEVESLRAFDLSTQRSVERVEEVHLLPFREVVLLKTMEDIYAENLRKASKGEDLSDILDVASRRGAFDGIERYLPLLYGDRTSLLDHLPPDALLFLDDPDGIIARAEAVEEEVRRAFERPQRDVVAPLSASDVLRPFVELQARWDGYRRVVHTPLRGPGEAVAFSGRGGRLYEGSIGTLRADLLAAAARDYDLNLLCENALQVERMEELLEEVAGAVTLSVGTLHEGFVYDAARLFVVNDHEVYHRYRRRSRYRRFKSGTPLTDYAALSRGDYVVHIDYGIGRFQGVERIAVDRAERDCLVILYRDKDKLYVPVDQLDRVQKYANEESAPPVLSKLGGAAWEKIKERTKKDIMKMAQELLTLYAERKAKAGFAFSPDAALQQALEASFPYQETPDQLRAVEEVKKDLEADAPMDRLICGDVGYGKTEVAVRAAFKAVADGKQVAVLVPTTILAQQHYRTFRERMRDLPVRVEVLSRFRTAAEQKKVVAALLNGGVDIVIGTHRLLSKDVVFKDLGLLVVDEEHRFGVVHKERIKQMRRLVDVMTLTATPIPRTLHMSLMGARDMSVINTPPRDRLPIHTEVIPFDEGRIAEAILREIDRGGQVYLVHNRVQSIHSMADFLRNLLPQIRFVVGHGQMPERELERVMLEFLDQKYDCLISTTIIESGLDIPSVNTILINRADRLGLAQLYQLRGRVGRSNRRAFAYLITPPRKSLPRDALRRLRAIEEFSDLGSGFHISMRDLEIRGAGNMLGAQQHGFIAEVGFDLYCRLLEEAVQELQGQDVDRTPDPKIHVQVSAFLPEDYLPDTGLKMDFYRRLADARQLEEVQKIEEELADRFGRLPALAISLLDVIRVKIGARKLGLATLSVGARLRMTFPEGRELERADVERMVAGSHLPLQFTLGPQTIVDADPPGRNDAARLSEVRKMMEGIFA
ncbi:MAG: transcription-repair coupling factor [Candidatus Latescibacteria bacterium]|nr:transcription-repair coupling factor [Candidatus Latescibacterota bacterium]